MSDNKMHDPLQELINKHKRANGITVDEESVAEETSASSSNIDYGENDLTNEIEAEKKDADEKKQNEYNAQKEIQQEKEAKKKQKVTEVKEIRLTPNIDDNDLNTKANMARKFLAKGDKVKVTLRFRGREMAHTATSKAILDTFFAKLEDVAVIERPARLEGRNMSMFLTEKR